MKHMTGILTALNVNDNYMIGGKILV